MTDTHYDKVEVLLPLNELVEKEYVEQYENETVLKMNMDGRYEDSADDPYINQVVLQMPMNGRVQDMLNEPYANNVVLQMSMDGDNGSTNFIDGTGKTVTVYGNAQISTAQSAFAGGSSAYFDGSGDYLTLPSSSDLAFGTSDFTIECWVYWIAPSGTQKGIFQISTNSSGGFGGQGGNLAVLAYSSTLLAIYYGGGVHTSSTTVSIDSRWAHIALVRNAGVTKLYVDGSDVLSISDTYNYTGTYGVIGGYYSSGYVFNGYIDDLRITKGVARYTANFTPPTQPNPKITQTIIFNDTTGKTVTPYGDAKISNIQSKFGGYSAYFDGSGDYLRTENPVFIGNGDITVELWYMWDGQNFDGGIICYGGHLVGAGFELWKRSSANGNDIELHTSTNTNFANRAGGFLINPMQWYHFVVQRKNAVWEVYIDGDLTYPYNEVTASTLNSHIHIGYRPYSTYVTSGWIDDVRVTAGVARYTPSTVSSDFQAPTSAFPDDSSDPYQANVVMHLHCDGTHQEQSMVDRTGRHTFTYVGTGSWLSTTDYKFDGSSYYAPGVAGNYAYTPVSTDFAFGTGDFTIEFWAKPTALDYFFGCGGTNTGANGWYIGATNTAASFYYNNTTILTVPGKNLFNNWHYYSVCRKNGWLYIHIDGLYKGKTLFSTSMLASYHLRLGSWGDYSSYSAFNGFLDEIRITKGVARYSATTYSIPVPTTPAKEVTQTSIWVDEKSHTVTPYGEATISNTQSKFGGYSAKFDGTGDYLEIPASSDYFLGTGDFTIEGWIYPETNFSTSRPIIVRGVSTDGYSLSIQATTGKLYLEIPNYTLASTNVLTLNTWQHIAVVRVGSTISMYINGVLNGTTPVLDWAETSAVLRIGTNRGTPSTYFLGYMDDVRITKVARYEAEFDPPTQFFEGSGAYWLPDYSKNDEDAPSYQLSLNTTTKKYDAGSIYFNGTTGYTRLQSIVGMSGKFCIEMWINPDNITGTKTLFGGKLSGFYIRQVDGRVGVYYGEANICLSGPATLAAGSWHHLAVTRDADSVVRVLVGGLVKTSATFDKRLYWLAKDMPYIGRDHNGNFYKGYMTDFRITAGESRYESTFTPPSKFVGTMSGDVKDSSSNPAVRTLFAVPRLSPTRIFGPVESSFDGTFSITVPNTEHVAVCLDTPTGDLNALVFDRIVPLTEV